MHRTHTNTERKLQKNKPTFYFNQHIIPKNYLIE